MMLFYSLYSNNTVKLLLSMSFMLQYIYCRNKTLDSYCIFSNS